MDLEMISPLVKEAVDSYLSEYEEDNGTEPVLRLQRVRLYGKNLTFVLQNWLTRSGLSLDACGVQDLDRVEAALHQKSTNDFTRFELTNNPLDSVQQRVRLLVALRQCHLSIVDLSGGTLSSRFTPTEQDNENNYENIYTTGHALRDLILEAECLETLNLRNNSFNLTVAQWLGSALAGCKRAARNKRPIPPPTLLHLDLSGCDVDDAMFRALIQPVVDRSASLGGGCRLQSLKLTRNKLTRVSLPLLSRYLDNSRARDIHELDLSLNSLLFTDVDNQDMGQFSHTIASHPSLEMLSLMDSRISAPNLDIFWRFLLQEGRSCKLKHLAISIPSTGTLSLMNALPLIQTIQVLQCVMPNIASVKPRWRSPQARKPSPENETSERDKWEIAVSKNMSLFQFYPLESYKETSFINRLRSYSRRNRCIHHADKLLRQPQKSINAIIPSELVKLRSQGGPTGIFVIVQRHFLKLDQVIKEGLNC